MMRWASYPTGKCGVCAWTRPHDHALRDDGTLGSLVRPYREPEAVESADASPLSERTRDALASIWVHCGVDTLSEAGYVRLTFTMQHDGSHEHVTLEPDDERITALLDVLDDMRRNT